jgi:hypothetical protein
MGQDTAVACEMDASDMWSQHLEEMGDRLNQQDGDRMGFLRMVNRNHLFNSSNYSLSSLFRYCDHRATGNRNRNRDVRILGGGCLINYPVLR